jgi:hypothetical protein
MPETRSAGPRSSGNGSSGGGEDPPGAKPPGGVPDFLSQQSTLTPGILGALVATIVLTVGEALQLNPIWSVIVLSFVTGLLLLGAAHTLLAKAVYYVLNSLIISSVAMTPVLSAKNATINTGATPPVAAREASLIQPLGVTVNTITLPPAAGSTPN